MGLTWLARYYNGAGDYLTVDTEDTDGMGISLPHYATHVAYQGAQAQVSWTNDIVTLTGGMDWAQQQYTGDDYEYWWGGWPMGPTYMDRTKYDAYGFFLLGKLSLLDKKLILSGGLRYDYYTLSFNNKTKNLDNLSPSVGVAWHATDWLTLRANYGVAYILPTPEAYAGGRWAGGYYLGNPDLKPEKSYGLDAGFDVQYRGLRAGLTYFQSVTTDPISSGRDGTTQKYFNMDGTKWLKGLEGNASFDLGEFFEWPFVLRPYVNFTWMLERNGYGTYSTTWYGALNNDITSYNGKTLLDIADWDLAFGVNFSHPEWGTNVDIRATYFGRQKVKNFERMDMTTWDSPIITIGNKTVVDIFLSQRLWRDEKLGEFSVIANVRNLFNEKYDLMAGYPMPGRSVYVGVKWEF